MKIKKILILGSTGMLGSMVLDFLSKESSFEITTPSRDQVSATNFAEFDYIINCIGIIKPKLKDPEEAIIVNSAFPYSLSRLAPKTKVIQIATDCVFSGDNGSYDETENHDATDIYGKTKSLGEVKAKNFYNIRCSIIGFDRLEVSLLSWFLKQKIVRGFTSQWWNGITTLHFAKLCYAIIKYDLKLPNVIHFIPRDMVNKHELLTIFKDKFKTKTIIKSEAGETIDRRLATVYPEINDKLWKKMGYKVAPLIEEMVGELALWPVK